MALSTYALTSVADAKVYLGIPTADTSKDTLLEALINQSTFLFERLTGRIFKEREITEVYSTNDTNTINLNYYPITAINYVRSGRSDAIKVVYGGTDIDWRVGITDSGLRLYSLTAAGTATTTNLAFSTYKTLSSLITAINAVSGWSATLQSTDAPTLWLNPDYLVKTDGKIWYLQIFDTELEYHFDKINGQIGISDCRFNWYYDSQDRAFERGFVNVLVNYTAGYSTPPDDIVGVCLQIVSFLYKARTNVGIKSETVGDYSVSFSESEITQINKICGPYITVRGI